MRTMTIGQIAKRAHVNIETLRYYERQGLIATPPRRESGYRQYPEEAVTRVRFIKRAQELGFSLKEIGELLSLRVDPSISCVEVKQRAEAKVFDIAEKIHTLQKMKEALTKLAETCSGRGPTSECPFLEALGKEEEKSAEE
ncbi:MerR family transcriptional regulator [Geomonas subterranea]|uniref:MerR family transcriptional regulator n=1 Tax=Geomonas subterranea TaxID=2847989 RepID=UPI001CD6A4F6|nr:MerR family transcriptional regulator [Geomonas fuzhouensis]